MPEKIVVGYDGSEGSKRALEFAMERAKAQGAGVVVAHVLEWSPYSFLTKEELEERHVRRKEELTRAEEHVLSPVVGKLQKGGVNVETALRYGNVADTLSLIAKETGSTQVVIGRTGESGLSSRIFGSVAGSLAQSCTVPVTIVP
ncbi:universal stress protein [Roseovarius sp. SCSIO 43702]|uniref:universal stress protein n=1 Tax=Roseovarius sp. SCSIO 43702 TaxID=2823043 RepID=UPI001C73B374|nr:universal stress protein [Roseovarius sp. SCSIO 43702]QYX55786.1 universal stress protein [Roseovarius sp. SCSIO 43702]